MVRELTTKENKKEVEDYINSSSKKVKEIDIRCQIDFRCIYWFICNSSFTKKLLPIWISDYVISSYGTGAVMAVPCGDARDYAFAKHFNIEIVNIFKDVNIDDEAFESKKKSKSLTLTF